MPNTPPQLIAGGNIEPHTFVGLSTSEEHQGVVAGTNGRIIGIAGPATRLPPLSDLVTGTNYAAVDGESFQLKGDGEICLLKAGGTVTAGIRLKSDSTGRGVAGAAGGTAIQNYGAISLQAGVANDLILVQVQISTERPALV